LAAIAEKCGAAENPPEKNSASRKSGEIKKFGGRRIFLRLIFGGSANRNMRAKF